MFPKNYLWVTFQNVYLGEILWISGIQLELED